jgi:ribosomal protein S18 acetylase RimI-like enzyme
MGEMKAHHRAFSPDESRFHVERDVLEEVAAEALTDPFVSILVADAGSKLLGFVKLRYVPKSWGHSCEVDLLAVDEKERGKGWGTALMDAVEKTAKARGVTGMRLNVSLGNDGAQRFYERRGYSQSAIRLGKALPE